MTKKLLALMFLSMTVCLGQTVIQGVRDIPEVTAPANPAANVMRVYVVDSGGTTGFAVKDSSGNVTILGQGLLGDAAMATSYSGTGTCTNQFARALNDAAAPTCATVSLTADVTGTVPVANGGTNLTAAADDNVMVGNATTWQTKALTNCNAANQAVTYNTSTNAWGCNTISGGGSSRIHFSPIDAVFPATSPAALQCRESSAAAPRPKWCELLFTTGERVMFFGMLPEDFATTTTPTLGVIYKMVSATTNNTEWTAAINCITPADAGDADDDAFATLQASADDTVPGTVGQTAVHTWNLTNNDGCAANDWMTIYFERSTPTGTDATGEAEVADFYLEYTP